MQVDVVGLISIETLWQISPWLEANEMKARVEKFASGGRDGVGWF
jgi:hypothetical protein